MPSKRKLKNKKHKKTKKQRGGDDTTAGRVDVTANLKQARKNWGSVKRAVEAERAATLMQARLRGMAVRRRMKALDAANTPVPAAAADNVAAPTAATPATPASAPANTPDASPATAPPAAAAPAPPAAAPASSAGAANTPADAAAAEKAAAAKKAAAAADEKAAAARRHWQKIQRVVKNPLQGEGKLKIHLVGSHNKVMRQILKTGVEEPENGSIFMVAVVTPKDDAPTIVTNSICSPIAVMIRGKFKKHKGYFGIGKSWTTTARTCPAPKEYLADYLTDWIKKFGEDITIDVLLWLRHGTSAHNSGGWGASAPKDSPLTWNGLIDAFGAYERLKDF